MGMYSFIRSFEFIRPLAYIFVEVGKASCVFCDDRNGRIWVNCITSRTEKKLIITLQIVIIPMVQKNVKKKYKKL